MIKTLHQTSFAKYENSVFIEMSGDVIKRRGRETYV